MGSGDVEECIGCKVVQTNFTTRDTGSEISTMGSVVPANHDEMNLSALAQREGLGVTDAVFLLVSNSETNQRTYLSIS